MGVVTGHVRYGFFWGKVAEGSPFDHTSPLHRHGWVELPDGRIWDPTRWVFEDVDPYIYIGDSDDYDPGMRKVRTSDGGSAAVEFLDAYLEGEREFDWGELMKVGNTFPENMAGIAAEVYEALVDVGGKATIPVDFWTEVMEGD